MLFIFNPITICLFKCLNFSRHKLGAGSVANINYKSLCAEFIKIFFAPLIGTLQGSQ